MGRKRRQPVKTGPIAFEMMEAGVRAIPIVAVLSITIGLMLAIQGINALQQFGAEHQVTFGVAISITREFAPLITGIVVAGRSGSALAARIGTMMIRQRGGCAAGDGDQPGSVSCCSESGCHADRGSLPQSPRRFPGAAWGGSLYQWDSGHDAGGLCRSGNGRFESERRDPRAPESPSFWGAHGACGCSEWGQCRGRG